MSFPILLDVSHHQGEMNWERAFESGARAAIIRAGSIPNEKDPPYVDREFKNNRTRAAQHMPVGYYWYFRPNRDPLIQAKFFADQVGGLKFFRLFNDVEDHGGKNRERVADSVLIFNDFLESQFGPVVGIYTRATFWNPFVARRPQWSKYDLWVARYVGRPGPAPWIDNPNIGVIENLRPADWKDWKIWQFSADSNHRGAEFGAKSGSIDINYFNGDFNNLCEYCQADMEPLVVPDIPAEVTSLSQPQGVCEITASVLNLRAGPSSHFADLGNLSSGTKLYWYESLGDTAGNSWLRVGPGSYISEKHSGQVLAVRK